MQLKDQLNAEDGSFLLELRTELNWNHQSFINLLTTLNTECIRTRDHTNISKEIASGIWYLSSFVKDWTLHKDFPKTYSKLYYETAYAIIDDLVYTYFMSEPPYTSTSEIEYKIDQLNSLL